MGLKEQLDSDLTGTFFAEGDFAESAVYRPTTGPEFSLAVLFEDPYVQVEPGGQGAIQSQAVRVMAPASKFPHPPGPGDLLVARGTTYRVVTAEPDGVGVISLCLHEDG